MALTKKHFEALAEIIKTVKDDVGDRTVDSVLHQIARDVADFSQVENSRFDRNRFLRACGLN